MKRIILTICCVVLLTGCWDRREINEIGIVVAIGIDQDADTGDIIFTSQVLNPSALHPEGGGAESPVKILTAKGDTVFKAIRNGLQQSDRQNFYSHNKVMVIGEQLAREGILPVLDGITRAREARGYVWLCVAKDQQAKDILNFKPHGIEQVPANYLEGVLENQNLNFDSTALRLNDYYKQSLKSGIRPVAGVLKIDKKMSSSGEEAIETASQHVKLSGGAVFQEDKLIGFLSEREARGYNWIAGEVKNGVLSLPSLLEEGKLVSIEIRKASSNLKTEIKGDHVSLQIDIETSGLLVEQQGAGTFETRKEQLDYLNRLEKELEALIEAEVNHVIATAQQDLKADIFGFGSTLNRKHPKKWNELKDEWEDHFQNAEVKVKVKANIGAQQLLKEPLNSKE